VNYGLALPSPRDVPHALWGAGGYAPPRRRETVCGMEQSVAFATSEPHAAGLHAPADAIPGRKS